MNCALHFLSEDLHEQPIFPVEAPDGRRDMTEIARQVSLFRDMHMLAPEVLGFAIPNAGKRNPVQARKEGILAGVFDTEWRWNHGSAFIELKGYDARGRAGKLSPAQIAFGNKLHRMGHRVGCFFTPALAIQFLRDAGAPFLSIREGRL